MDTAAGKRGGFLSRLRRKEGAQLVEFALVAPLLLVLAFGIIEFGVILYDQAVITNASREGARYLSKYPATGIAPTQSDVSTYVQTYVANRIIDFTSSAPSPAVSFPAETAGYDGVQVSYSYRFLVFGSLIQLIGGSISPTLNLSSTTVMQIEN